MPPSNGGAFNHGLQSDWRPRRAPSVIEHFLIDECLTPKLAAVARDRGHMAGHIAWLGLAGRPDYQVFDFMMNAEHVLVTNNARDFRRALAKADLHGGLVVIVPSVNRDLQKTLFAAALDVIESMPHVMNKVVEVHTRDDIRVSDLPPPPNG